MTLQRFEYTCAQCRSSFHALELPGEFTYGEFLLRNPKTGNIRYLSGFADSEYAHVGVLVRNLPSVDGMKDADIAILVQKVFGHCCDKDLDGGVFEIDANPSCPKCHSNRIASWTASDPPILESHDVPPVTHTGWDKLTEAEMVDVLNREIKKLLAAD